MLSLPSLLIIMFGTFFVYLLIFVFGRLRRAGRLRFKTLYLAIGNGIAIFVVILTAIYVNDAIISVFALVLSGLIAIFCGVTIYFAFELVKRIKG